MNNLKLKSADITYINKETMKPECSFNQCIKKFELLENYVEKTIPQRGRPIAVKKRYVYECNQCGRKVEGEEPDIS